LIVDVNVSGNAKHSGFQNGGPRGNGSGIRIDGGIIVVRDLLDFLVNVSG
jgi:hypothetical protein